MKVVTGPTILDVRSSRVQGHLNAAPWDLPPGLCSMWATAQEMTV